MANHDIVFEICSSVYGNNETKPYGYKNGQYVQLVSGDFKQYHVACGSTFTDCFNEELDSATVVLDHILDNDRLVDIQPYDFVRVFDANSWNSTTQKYDFDKEYLVDNFTEKEINIFEHFYEYTIELFSQTKLLEKIQCPNLTITHTLGSDGSVVKKTIAQYIQQYLELYSPKIKFKDGDTGWKYKQLITVPSKYDTYRTCTENNFSVGQKTWTESIAGEEWYTEGDITTGMVGNVKLKDYTITTDGTMIISNFRLLISVLEYGKIHFVLYYRSATNPKTTFQDFLNITINYYDNTSLNSFWVKFNANCADLSFNCPTLRQLLTTLMQQVGCIPVLKNYQIGYLDFNGTQEIWTHDYETGNLDNTINYVQSSLSSDSYVNTFKTLADGVLDSENEVICETLGFRDNSSILLKQKENLTLETSFPIYKVNEFKIKSYAKITSSFEENERGTIEYTNQIFSSSNFFIVNNSPSLQYHSSMFDNKNSLYIENGENKLDIYFWLLNKSSCPILNQKNTKVHFLKKNSSTYKYYIYFTEQISDFVFSFNSKDGNDDIYDYDPNGYWARDYAYKKFTLTGLGLSSGETISDISGYYVESDCENTSTHTTYKQYFIKFYDSELTSNSHVIRSINQLSVDSRTNHAVLYNIPSLRYAAFFDATKLLKESQERSLLKTDISQMTAEIPDPSSADIDKLSKYVYGTLGYTIGSKKITGFSNVYTVEGQQGLSWISAGYTYIENIMNCLLNLEGSLNNILGGYLGIPIVFGTIPSVGTILNKSFSFFDNIEPGKINFATLTFDIKYQPLNSFNLNYVKSDRDISIPLEQYDSSASSNTDFDRLSAHEQENVDRIGNRTVNISQRVVNFGMSQIKPLNTLFNDKYTIFRRTFTVNNNCYNVQYTASENAVLKNYFTSIRTKYRAYQYVDYSSATLRKENNTFYVRIGRNYLNGDDKVWFGNFNNGSGFNQLLTYFIRFSSNNSENKVYYNSDYSYGINNSSSSVLESVKKDVSLITNSKTLAFITESRDNVGEGTYLPTLSVNDNLGGIVQKWQIWDQNYYNEKFLSSFFKKTDFFLPEDQVYNPSITVLDDSTFKTRYVDVVGNMPIITTFINLDSENNILFSLTDDNSTSAKAKKGKTMYKDGGERIQQTTQFVYYTDEKTILWTEYFIKNCTFVQNSNFVANDVKIITNFAVDKEVNSIGTAPSSTVISNYISYSTTEPAFTVTFPANVSMFKIVHDNGDGTWNDIVAFKRRNSAISILQPESDTYYVSLNDTKSDYVWKQADNGLLYKYGTVHKYTTGDPARIVDELYSS